MNLNHLLCILFMAFGYSANAQCPVDTAGQLSGTMVTMLDNDTTNAPIYTVSPGGLPNTEFVIIQNDSLASDGFGPRVITTSLTGLVVPSDYGLGTCNEVCIVPFSYDLSQLRTVVDSLFGAMYLPGTTCCAAAGQFFLGICDSLVAHGISSGADVTNLNDVIVLMGIFAGTSSGGSISLNNFTQTIDGLNSAMTLFGPCAGGILELCYAVENSPAAMDCYTVVLPNSATSVDIVQDTVWIAPGSTIALTGSFSPASATDSITWYLSDTLPSISVDPITGFVTAGSIADTNYVIAQAVHGCATDVMVVIVDPALAVPEFNMTETTLQAIPNPFSNSLQVQFHAQEGDYTLQLIGTTGQVLYTQMHRLASGNQQISIDTEQIPNGYYFLRIIGKNTQGTQAVLKN